MSAEQHSSRRLELSGQYLTGRTIDSRPINVAVRPSWPGSGPLVGPEAGSWKLGPIWAHEQPHLAGLL